VKLKLFFNNIIRPFLAQLTLKSFWTGNSLNKVLVTPWMKWLGYRSLH